ncbi:TetR/AcrR family transcriptional regulator C-terminal domain-containing protein [Kitasatospora sp. NPDC057015]|uniref:TetR/AcrR family transcriptional regulator C-terminal domain-containing protein n=1 Tax=Kitasatospora sp. NPDC057015 TaxID=3346001 RepID=UPI00363D6335
MADDGTDGPRQPGPPPEPPGADVTPHPGLTPETIAQAALRVLEREGIDGLSMRKVGAELGVKAASLYWHVRNKEQLLDLLTDALMADAVPPPREGPWRDQLRSYCERHRQHLLGKRDAAKVVAGRLAPGPHMLRLMDDQLGRLRDAGFPDADAALASYLLGLYVHGFVLQEQTPMSASEAMGAGRREVATAVGDQFRRLPEAEFPHVVALAGALTEPSMDARFAFGLERLLDGLAALLDEPAPTTPHSPSEGQHP